MIHHDEAEYEEEEYTFVFMDEVGLSSTVAGGYDMITGCIHLYCIDLVTSCLSEGLHRDCYDWRSSSHITVLERS